MNFYEDIGMKHLYFGILCNLQSTHASNINDDFSLPKSKTHSKGRVYPLKS